MKRVPSSDRKSFLDALALWDRPEEQLYGKVLDRDLDTDGFVERLFSNPRAGLLDS